MTAETKHIHVEPESELGRLLDEAGNMPVILEKDGERYHLVKESTASPDQRTEKVMSEADDEAFLSAAGGWADVDIDSFLKNIYESRQSARPPVVL
jgi:hypothetical protein